MQLSTNSELRKKALKALRGNWSSAVVAFLVYSVIVSVLVTPVSISYQNLVSDLSGRDNVLWGAPFFMGDLWRSISAFSGVLYLLIGLPLAYGFIIAFVKAIRMEGAVLVDDLFVGFRSYSKTISTMLLMAIYILLWSLLLYIPGIVKSYSYAMTPYLLAEHPQMSSKELIEKSMSMMKGHKAKLFWLDMSFIGWALLSIVTCGVAMLWVTPYAMMSRAAFYLELKEAMGE